ncbi:MAG TPA: aminotransferase class I/II-fold pyridoxal phosphate-dependent enzyme [Segeticoccus sp.]|uniref:aminotransferase class I/II-fold pyridoxal phosphate-dependent enzyme n=1 Tax=Segeticoccus sp. TaxID=2706531 RepID=UPI002D809FEF|nr:aminotransferase class I/II-fold pyridoxal phosphate-dependent enzyme [Segeticoccus sp.]HET8599761.1 aminotransferase class I/II-fold pyridoxal phosphate-dependent enzyme [Segeticoccus sp.]
MAQTAGAHSTSRAGRHGVPTHDSLAALSAIEERLEDPSARGLANAVSNAVRDGVIVAGTRLPPIREVATQLALSPTTVSASWSLLSRSGTIHTEGRRGTTVTDPGTPAAGRYRQALEHQSDFALDLSTGVPDAALLPSLGQALRALRTAGTPGSYLEEPVLPRLLDVLRDDWPYAATELTVVDGAMDGIEQIARTTLRFGDRVAVEHPCFPPLVDLLESMGVRTVGVPVDEDGMSAADLAEALTSPIVAVVLQPRAQNPTGVSLSERRARELVKALRPTNTLVIEDDSAGAIATSPALSLGRWLPGQTVHIRSFSKSHGPDLRLAALSGPAPLMHEVRARRQVGQGWSSRLLQRILLSLLTEQESIAQVEHARVEYARRRSALVDALEAHGIPVGGSDGINIWVPVHDETATVVRLASQGIGVTPGAPFAVLDDEEGHIRVTCGLLAEGQADLAQHLAAAARTRTWRPRAR